MLFSFSDIRDWLNRRLKQRLAEARKQQREQLQRFFVGLSDVSHKCFRKQVLLNRIDTRNYFRRKKEAEEREKAAKRLREEEERKHREEEERKHREEEERKRREAEERKHREAEERKRREAEERKHREAEEERCRELEEARLREAEEKRDKKEDNTGFRGAETDETTLENLKRSSAVLSGGQAGRKKRSKEEFTGSVLTTHSEAAEEEILVDSMSKGGFSRGKGNAVRQNGHSQIGHQVRQTGWRENGPHHSNGIGGGQSSWNSFENGLEDSVEDSSQKQHKPLIATFEPVSLGVNRPKRHLMKIRSNPLTDSGEIMVVSAGTSNESHVGDSDDIPVNGYMFSETSIVSNGCGLSSPDDIIVMNGAPLSGGSNFGNGVHRIVLNDDDYDDTVSPTGDLVDEIYENTAMSIPESAQVDNLARTSSDDNIYEEVGTNDPNSEEFPIDSSANEYCAPIPSKYAIHFPDFDQKPGKYRDPTTVMNQPPIPSIATNGNCKDAPSRATEKKEAGKGPTSPIQSQGETTNKSDEIYENAAFFKQSQTAANESRHPFQRQACLQKDLVSRLSYSTGRNPMDDEDYEDTQKLPSPKKHSVPSPSPHFHRRNISLDGEVFLPNSQSSSSSSSSVYNKMQHSVNANFRRRPVTKMKKSSSSSSAADPIASLSSASSQSSVVGGSQEALNGPVNGMDARAKSPVSPRKNQPRKGLKYSQSEVNCSAVSSRPPNPFVPTSPLPPIPSELLSPPSSRTNMPLPPPPSLPSLSSKVTNSKSSSEDTDYDYIGSNTLEKALKTAASPYLKFQHQPNLSVGPPPQPYTQPIQRKNKNTKLKSSNSVPPNDPAPLPMPSPIPTHRKCSIPPNANLMEYPIDSRPPALPPVFLSDNRPPAPLPPEATQGSSSSHSHQPLIHTKSLYTQDNSSSSNGKAQNHPPLKRGVSAAVLSRVQESRSEATARPLVPRHRNQSNQSPSPPSTSPNRSPLIPPRFPPHHAPPPANPPPAAPPTVTPPNKAKEATPTSSGAAPRPPPPPAPPQYSPSYPSPGTATKTSPPPQKRKTSTPISSVTDVSAVKLKKVNSPPTASTLSPSAGAAVPLSQNSLIVEIQALKLKQRPKNKGESDLSSRRKRSNSEENVLGINKEEEDSTVVKVKLRATSSVQPDQAANEVKPLLKSSSSSTSSLLSTTSSSSASSTSASSTSASSSGNNSIPEWKRLLLEKKQQQQLQKQQSKVRRKQVFYTSKHNIDYTII